MTVGYIGATVKWLSEKPQDVAKGFLYSSQWLGKTDPFYALIKNFLGMTALPRKLKELYHCRRPHSYYSFSNYLAKLSPFISSVNDTAAFLNEKIVPGVFARHIGNIKLSYSIISGASAGLSAYDTARCWVLGGRASGLNRAQNHIFLALNLIRDAAYCTVGVLGTGLSLKMLAPRPLWMRSALSIGLVAGSLNFILVESRKSVRVHGE